jgi:hypothetical protein
MSDGASLSTSYKSLLRAKIIVVTGAGASVPLGMPAMRGFFAKLDPKSKAEAQRFGAWCPDSKDDLEFLLGQLDWWRQLGEAAHRDNVFRGVIKQPDLQNMVASAQSLREAVLQTIVDLYGELSNEAQLKACSIYREFYSILRQKAFNSPSVLPVFTTNYDLTFEGISDQDRAFRICNGMERRGYYSEWQPETYKREQYDFGIFRLHGCSHWVRQKKNGKILYQPIPERDNLSRREPCILYPEPLKDSLVSGEPFSIAYENLRLCLRGAKLIIIIGYSGRDETVRDAFREALYADPDKKFIFVTKGRAESAALEGLVDSKKVLAYFDKGIEDSTSDILDEVRRINFAD